MVDSDCVLRRHFSSSIARRDGFDTAYRWCSIPLDLASGSPTHKKVCNLDARMVSLSGGSTMQLSVSRSIDNDAHCTFSVICILTSIQDYVVWIHLSPCWNCERHYHFARIVGELEQSELCCERVAYRTVGHRDVYNSGCHEHVRVQGDTMGGNGGRRLAHLLICGFCGRPGSYGKSA